MTELADLPTIAPERGGMLIDCSGATLKARGCHWPIGTLVSVEGHAALAECVGFRGDTALLAPLTGCEGLTSGMRVAAYDAEEGLAIPFGRTIDAMGRPVDGQGPCTSLRWSRPALRALSDARPVTTAIETGLRAIDGLLTLGHGQRVTIAAPAGSARPPCCSNSSRKLRSTRWWSR